MDASSDAWDAGIRSILDGQDIERNSSEHSGLPLLEHEQDGGIGGSAVRTDDGQPVNPSLRSEDGKLSGSGKSQDDIGTGGSFIRGLSDGSVGNGQDSISINKVSVLRNKKNNDSSVSDVAQRYWSTAEISTSDDSENGILHSDGILNTQPEKFGRVTQSAIAKLEEILEVELDSTSRDYTKIMSIQKDAASNVVSMALKADETKFRIQSLTGINEILRRVKIAQDDELRIIQSIDKS